jgi:hypothetical protein
MNKNLHRIHKLRLKRLLLSFLFFTLFASAWAQIVTDTITDEKNKPVNGATITGKGTTKATAGAYSGSLEKQAPKGFDSIRTNIPHGKVDKNSWNNPE